MLVRIIQIKNHQAGYIPQTADDVIVETAKDMGYCAATKSDVEPQFSP
jgi:hypothetical protein